MEITTKYSRLTSVALLALFAGCASKITYLPPGTTYGDITVSKPRVSTRERLINDRLEEEAWLRAQLRDTDNKEFGVQGKTDIRSFAGMFARVGIQADPNAISLYREAKSQELEDAKRQRALKDLDYQIALAKKQKELDDANANPAAAQSTYYPGQPVGAGSAAPAPKVDEKTQGQLENLAKGIETFNQKLGALSGGGPEGAPASAAVSASPIDLFRDRLAYREEVRSELIQNALDDAHDLASNTLYRLSFDTTVFPGSDTSAWAVVGIEVTLPEDGGLISPEEFARIVNSKIDEVSSEYGTQLTRECTTVRLPDCILNLRSDALAQLSNFAKLATGTENPSLAMFAQRAVPQQSGRPFLTIDEAQQLARVLHSTVAKSGEPNRDTVSEDHDHE